MMSQTKQEQEAVIACDLNVFTPEQLEHHLAVCETLFAAVREVRDLPDWLCVSAAGRLVDAAMLADFIAASGAAARSRPLRFTSNPTAAPSGCI